MEAAGIQEEAEGLPGGASPGDADPHLPGLPGAVSRCYPAQVAASRRSSMSILPLDLAYGPQGASGLRYPSVFHPLGAADGE